MIQILSCTGGLNERSVEEVKKLAKCDLGQGLGIQMESLGSKKRRKLDSRPVTWAPFLSLAFYLSGARATLQH